jgi:hypothetical protein
MLPVVWLANTFHCAEKLASLVAVHDGHLKLKGLIVMNMTTMNERSRHQYIADCELAECSHSLKEHMSLTSKSLLDPSDMPPSPQAAVVGGSLLAFTDSVTTQNREDIMDSFLFATLVANKAFNPETESQLWYGKFNQVLAAVGWLSSSWSYARYRATQTRFSMDQVGLEILGSVIAAAALPGPASLAMLKVASDAVTALKAKEEPLRLFDRQTKTHNGASFRIGACTESANGSVVVAMGAVNFTASSNITTVLFWEYNNAEVSTFRGEDQLVLNSRVYARNRQLIQNMLGDKAQSAIEEFDI